MEIKFETEHEANQVARKVVEAGIKVSYVKYEDGKYVVSYEDTE